MAREICLVTGGSGFIGSHICEALLRSGLRVRILDNFSSGKKEHIESFVNDIELIQGSILDEKILSEVMGGVSYVFHQAAIRSVSKSVHDPMASNEANVTGTLKVLNAAKNANVKKLIYASSSSLYGDGKTFPQVETLVAQPISPYAVSKLGGELYCRVYTKAFGLPTIALRYFNVYGPRQDPESMYSAVIPGFMEKAIMGKPLEVHWDGKQSRDFTYVGDIASANLIAMKAPEAAYGEAFNIASGKGYSLLELIEFLEKTLGRKLQREHGPRREGDVRKTSADISKAKKILGFKPKMTFKEGLARTWEFFSQKYQGAGV